MHVRTYVHVVYVLCMWNASRPRPRVHVLVHTLSSLIIIMKIFLVAVIVIFFLNFFGSASSPRLSLASDLNISPGSVVDCSVGNFAE